MKRIVVFTLSIICLLGVMAVYADKTEVSEIRNTLTQMKIIDKEGFSSSDTVTREECIIAIMRVIGVTDKEVNLLNGADLYTFADTEPYSYAGCAYVGKIAYGEKCIIDYPTYRTLHTGKNTDFFFFPDRAVTVKEMIAFMIRCLEETNGSDFDTIFEKAKDYGIIKDEDTFVQSPDSVISQDDVCILLGRMLQQKRYKYYTKENNRFRMDGNIDIERSMTYFEFLTQRPITE